MPVVGRGANGTGYPKSDALPQLEIKRVWQRDTSIASCAPREKDEISQLTPDVAQRHLWPTRCESIIGHGRVNADHSLQHVHHRQCRFLQIRQHPLQCRLRRFLADRHVRT